MTHFPTYMLLILFATLLGISQCSDDCFYHPGDPGKKCFVASHAKYTCCPLDHRCEDGKCTPLNASPPSNHLSLQTYVLIGVGVVCFVCSVGLIIVAIYWHHLQRKKTEKLSNPFSSFSQSTNGSSRRSTSVGYRITASTTQPSAFEATVNIQPPTIS